MPKPIYLDYNGTTPHDPEVIDAMRPFFEEEFGNPSSSHWYGIKPKRAVENARRRVAALLNCKPEEIIFTSGGPESNNHAIKGAVAAKCGEGNHIVTTEIEHPATLEVCAYLERIGYRITRLPVDEFGVVDVFDVERAVSDDTILITVMHANNEVGSIQPLEEIAEIAKAKGILFHTDAAQSLGKIPVDTDALGVDLLSVAGHKIYAPKGIGALYIRERLKLDPFVHGAGQERGLRAGTENVMEIVGLGKACEIAKRDIEKNAAAMRRTRDRLHDGLKARLHDLRLNGHPEKRLPNTLSLSFRGLDAGRVLEEIGLEIAASAGAACHSDTVEISHVLRAMNVPEEWAKGTLRFTTGRRTTDGKIDRALEVITNAVEKLIREAPDDK